MTRLRPAARARRCMQAGFVALMAALALLPAAAQLAGFNAWRVGENRAQAALPAAPQTLDAVRAWPRAVDAALNDRFGLRSQFVSLHDQMLFRLFGAFTSRLILAGPGGRLFVAGAWSHSLVRIACGKGLPDGRLPQLVTQAEAVLRGLEQRAPRAEILVVPSAQVLFPAELPSWLRPDCETGPVLAEQVLDRLPFEWRERIAYPLSAMRAPGLAGPPIPRRDVHWDAVGAAAAIDAWAEQRGLPRRPDLPVAWHRRPSDLSGFFPGLSLSSMVLEPVLDTPGIEQCLGWPCFPAIADETRMLVDVRRFRTMAGGERVLVLSDSFGAAAVPWLARHFGEVWQINVNYLQQLSPAQRRTLERGLLDAYRPDRVVLIMLDASMTRTLPRMLSLLD